MDYNFFESTDKSKKKSGGSSGLIMIILIVVVTAALGGLTAMKLLETNSLKTEMDSTRSQIENNKRKAELLSAKLAQSKELSQTAMFFEALDEAAVNSRTANTKVLDYIAGELPAGCEISQMNIKNKLVTLKGSAPEQELISEFWKKLDDSKNFTEIKVTKIEGTTTDSSIEQTYKFNMELNIDFIVGSEANNGGGSVQ